MEPAELGSLGWMLSSLPWLDGYTTSRAPVAGQCRKDVPAVLLQAMSQDLLTATMEIPFSVPPYSALLGRSVASLEGIALLGDPNYQACKLARLPGVD